MLRRKQNNSAENKMESQQRERGMESYINLVGYRSPCRGGIGSRYRYLEFLKKI